MSDDLRHLEKLRDEEIEKGISDEETPRTSKSGRTSVNSTESGSGRLFISSHGSGRISVNSSRLRTPSSVNGKQEPELELTPSKFSFTVN